MRKKEENQVHRKTVAKRNTGGISNNNHLNIQNGCDMATNLGRPVSTTHNQSNNIHQNNQLSTQNGSSNFNTNAGNSHSTAASGTGVGMNMRTRLKF